MTGPITGDSIGGVHIGARVDSTLARCPGSRDTAEMFTEGMRQRLVRIPSARDTIIAEVVDDRISRLRVTTNAFATIDSIHIGTPVSRLRDDSTLRAGAGEGQLFVFGPRRCGLSFGLTPGVFPNSGPFDSTAIDRIPASTPVTLILVLGCRSG